MGTNISERGGFSLRLREGNLTVHQVIILSNNEAVISLPVHLNLWNWQRSLNFALSRISEVFSVISKSIGPKLARPASSARRSCSGPPQYGKRQSFYSPCASDPSSSPAWCCYRCTNDILTYRNPFRFGNVPNSLTLSLFARDDQVKDKTRWTRRSPTWKRIINENKLQWVIKDQSLNTFVHHSQLWLHPGFLERRKG